MSAVPSNPKEQEINDLAQAVCALSRFAEMVRANIVLWHRDKPRLGLVMLEMDLGEAEALSWVVCELAEKAKRLEALILGTAE